MTLVVLGLLTGLLYLVFTPFWHPRTHLVLLTGSFPEGRTDLLGIPAAEYVAEDFSEFLPLEKVLYQGIFQRGPVILGNLQSREEMKSLSEQLDRLAIGGSDVLIVYVSAAGVSQDGTAYVLCSHFDPANPRASRYPLRSLLQQISSTQAAVKLVVMEAGREDYDPARGMLINEFPRLMAEELKKLRDEDLWVLCSHGLGERSHVSPALRRSLFGYFVAKGLGGAADLNGDRVIYLDELHRFVRTQVARWVEASSGGRATQTPWVASGRTISADQWPALLGVIPVEDDQPALDHRETIVESQRRQDAVSKGELRAGAEATSYIHQQIARVTPGGRLGTHISDFTREKVDRASQSVTGSGANQAASADGVAGGPRDASTSEPAAAPSEASATAAKTDSSSEPAAQEGAGSGAGSEDATKLQSWTMSELLNEAWRVRDLLDAADRAGPRPIDYAPHWWRTLQEQLISYERRQRIDPVAQGDPLEVAMRRLVMDLRSLERGDIRRLERSRTLVQRVASWHPAATTRPPPARSLAEATMYAEQFAVPLSPTMQQWMAELDRHSATSSRADVEAWLAQLPEDAKQLFEVRFATQLAGRARLEWPLALRCLGLRRLAEQIAVQSWSLVPWIATARSELDTAREQLERRLLDHLDVDQAAAVQQIEQLVARYEQLRDALAQVRSSIRLRNDLLFRARYYIDWYHAAGGSVDVLGFRADDLTRLLGDLAELNRLLEAPAADSLSRVAQLAESLRQQRKKIEQRIDFELIDLLVAPPVDAGEPWRMERLLATPLAAAPARKLLLESIGAAEVDFFQSFDLPEVDRSDLAARHGFGMRDWQLCRNLLELEGKLAQLGTRSPDRQLDIVESAQQQFQQAYGHWKQSEDAEATELWAACAHYEEVLEGYYRNLPGQIERNAENVADLSDATVRPVRLNELIHRFRNLFLVDGRAGLAFTPPPLAELLQRAHTYDWLVDRAQSWQAARTDVTRIEAEYLGRLANDYRASASALPLQPPLAPLVPLATVVDSTSQVSLSVEHHQDSLVTYRYEGTEPVEAWLLLDYDSRLMAVRSHGEAPVYRQADVDAGISSPGVQNSIWKLRREALLALRPSLRLEPRQTYTVSLTLQRLQGSLHPTPLIIKVVTRSEVVRGETEVLLPAPEWAELIVTGVPGSWTLTGSGAELHSFANRSTEYRLALANRSTTSRTVDVQLIELAAIPQRKLPEASLSAQDTSLVMAEMTLGKLVAAAPAISLPADGREVAIAFPPPPPAEPADAAAAGPPPASCKGLLLMITDKEQNQSVLKHLEFVPQRPARFLRPVVSYDPRLGRIQIDVTPLDATLLPPEGVRVQADVEGALTPAAERRLDGIVQAPQFRARLYAEVAPAAGRVVTVHLHVDDFPRAFIFRVPCERQVRDIPADTDVQSIRIASLPEGLVYKAPAGSIPVQLEVDVPAGALDQQGDYVEVGLDRDRDREFAGEPTVRLHADREVEVSVEHAGPQGLLRLQTRVEDLRLALHDQSRQSGRANVLARLVAGGNVVWSAPVEVVLDGTAPAVSDVRMRPGERVEIGKDLLVSAAVDDKQLSGVGKVEVAFDMARSGKFPEGDGVIPLELDADGRWTGKVPTKPLAAGPYNLLVRATDQLGNEGQPARVPVQVAPPSEAAEAQQMFAEVAGTVVYGRQPQSGIKVTLRPEATPPPAAGEEDSAEGLRTAVTDDQGRFRFAEVPAGKFVVGAAGVVRNKPRQVDTTITIEPPNEVPPVQLKLP